jgi:hypothetical protein
MRWFALCASVLSMVGLAGCAATADPGYPGTYAAGPETSYAYEYAPYGPYYYGYNPYGYYCCGLGFGFVDRFHHFHSHHFHCFHGHVDFMVVIAETPRTAPT